MATTTLEQRKQIIKLHNKGKKQPEISYLLDIPQTTVSFWLRRWKKTESVESKPKPGKKPMLSKEQISELKLYLHENKPNRYGGESVGWTTKLVIKHVKEKYGVKYSMRRMQELMHKLELNLISPRSEAKKGSHASRVVYREYFKKNWKENVWVTQ